MRNRRNLTSISLLLAIAGTADAFQPGLDQFWRARNGVETFRDSDNDKLAPPHGPDGPTPHDIRPRILQGERKTDGHAFARHPGIINQVADTVVGATRRSSTKSVRPNLDGLAARSTSARYPISPICLLKPGISSESA